MSARSARRGAPCAALICVLTACHGEPGAPDVEAPPPAVAPAAPSIPPAAGPATAREPQLCTVLANVVASEPAGFAPLRGRPLAAAQWHGRTTLPGTERCTIEGEAWPAARYSCAGAPLAAEEGDGVQGTFEALAADLDQCLDSPIWYPRTWKRGSAFEFAMGERLQAWTDHSTSPPSQVVLKVQQDADGSAYRVKLDVQSVP
jgi:hypothetical protein